MDKTLNIDNNKQTVLICPICSNENTHLRSVELYNARVDEDRMSALLKFDCECGHSFTLDIMQYKGMTVLQEKK